MKNILLITSIILFGSCADNQTDHTQNNSTDGTNFSWDFSKQRKFIYSYSQENENINEFGTDENMPVNKTSMSAIGKLHIRVKENNMADFSLIDIQSKMVMYDGQGNPNDTISQTNPVMTIQDIKPDGSIDDTNADVLFMTLMPLPKTSLKKGESEALPLKMPFNAGGSRLFSKGENTLTFQGYEEIDGRNCAVLKGLIDVSKLEIPEELTGDYKCITTGEGTYYFDIENKYYVGADVSILMEALIASEPDSTDGFGMNIQNMRMKANNKVKIRLENIEE